MAFFWEQEMGKQLKAALQQWRLICLHKVVLEHTVVPYPHTQFCTAESIVLVLKWRDKGN